MSLTKKFAFVQHPILKQPGKRDDLTIDFELLENDRFIAFVGHLALPPESPGNGPHRLSAPV